jgi:hypothetical protein
MPHDADEMAEAGSMSGADKLSSPDKMSSHDMMGVPDMMPTPEDTDAGLESGDDARPSGAEVMGSDTTESK